MWRGGSVAELKIKTNFFAFLIYDVSIRPVLDEAFI